MKQNLLNKTLLLSILCLLPQALLAQEDFYKSSKTIIVSTPKDINVPINTLSDLIKRCKGIKYTENLEASNYSCQFSIPLKNLFLIDSFANTLGYVNKNAYSTNNLEHKLSSLKQDIEEHQVTIANIKESLKDTTLGTEKRNEKKEKLERSLDLLREKELLIKELKKSIEDSSSLVNFSLLNENSTPTNSNSRLAFVNMPGIEYGTLQVENPKSDRSFSAYQGVALKYLFTKGKSFFNMGVYRAVDNKISSTADSSRIDELFLINFGQDFYPRHFGRGSRKYLNLYTGYQVGGFISHQLNDRNSSFIPNIDLALGLELIKTKHILLDSKLSYFVPFGDLNRNMRGLFYRVSFNFIF